jgi:type III restriction enzyme
MEWKFDANQEYQVAAIEAVADLLEGQPRLEVELNLELGAGLAAAANRLDLDEAALLENVQQVQTQRGIASDDALQTIEAEVETAGGTKLVRFPNFSVEMETGTGKTYVYLRTALELFRRYGLRKFIVVVPSVAVREGVLKTLQMTKRHFEELFDNTPLKYYVYDSANLTQVRQFALSSGVELMVMTLDAFNKAANVIRQSTDKLQGETPIHLVQAARPILILDEPQNMESEKSVAALATLDPLFALRYSATHRNPYNVIYRLTPFDAYRQGLVKKIEVASVVKESDHNQAFLRVESIESKKNTITAKVSVHQLMKDGSVKEKTITIKPGDSLETKTGRPDYGGFEVDEINPGSGSILFANGVEVKTGESRGADKEALFEAQIRYTVGEHFRKQARLESHGIKVLSLFFIDRVANYCGEDGESGLIRRLFDKAFDELKADFPQWSERSVEDVQAAYFAQRRKGKDETVFEDSTTGAAKKDEEAYDLIMRDKERLLSFDTSTAFIFSHSALREGWDNPNVFQICTLNQSTSEVKKRQEIGRGVRLARNARGDVTHDERVNILTVIANESYERYVSTLQQEIEDEYGQEGLPPKPVNARERGVARLRKEYMLRPEFQELWERIKHKTRYAVQVDSEKLIAEVVAELDKAAIKPPRVTITKARVEVSDEEDSLQAFQMTASKTALDLSGRQSRPDLIGTIAHLLEYTTPPVSLSRRTLLEIFKRTGQREAAVANPFEFATIAVRVIKEKLADHLVQGIHYEKLNEWYEMALFEAEVEPFKEYLVPSDRSIYDHVACDSTTEKKFVEGMEKRDDVKLYIKLPNWFKVPTPVGEYNPDWALVMDDRDSHGDSGSRPLLYLVRETKSSPNLDDLRPDERRKILCGKQHFEHTLGTNYRVVTTASELP